VSTDRSWTIAPTLLSFSACMVAGLVILDGDVQALADRVTTKRDAEGAQPAGPGFAPRPVIVADAPDVDDAQPVAAAIADTGDRARVGALEDVCLDGTPERCKRWGMDGFYQAIAASKRDTLGRAVRVSWYGDSVVATDALPARLRARLQGELGDGGPGFVYIVPPHRFCHHEAVTRTTNGEWRTHAISTQPHFDGLYGVGGSTVETHGGRATVKLAAGTASQVELYYVAQPHGGTAVVTADGVEIVRADTRAERKQAGHAAATVAAGAKKLEIAAQGKLRLYGLQLENPKGAVVDNFGIVSVHAKNFAGRDVDDFTAELAHRSPDLVLIMIGANEAQWLASTERAMKTYRASFERALAPLRNGRPDGACLVVAPLDQAEAKDGAYPSRDVMPGLVDAQRQAAHAQGCAFFSTYGWMGGKGSAAKWFKRGLVGSDFQHLSRKGANKLADGLFDALMTGYQRHGEP